MVQGVEKPKYCLTPEYWNKYLEQKKKARLFYGQVKEGIYKNTVHEIYVDEDLEEWNERLLNNEITVKLRQHKKRKGKPLPLDVDKK